MSCSIHLGKKCKYSILVIDKKQEQKEFHVRKVNMSWERRNFFGRWVRGSGWESERGSYTWKKKTREVQPIQITSEINGALNNCVCRCAAASNLCSQMEIGRKRLEMPQNTANCEASMSQKVESLKQEGIAAGYDGIERRDDMSFSQDEPIWTHYAVVHKLATEYGINNIRNVNMTWGHWEPKGKGVWLWTEPPKQSVVNWGYDNGETVAIIDDTPTGTLCRNSASNAVAVGYSNLENILL